MLENLSGIYMGIVYDTLRILGLDYKDFYLNIKPKAGYSEIVHGPVFTTYGEVVNVSKEEYSKLDNIRLEMYNKENFRRNPIVFLQSNDDKVAHSGDITTLIYKKLGAVGFVTDGNVRDIDIIDNMNFPVFCRDENPIDALYYWALVEFDKKIKIDGVKISPKDYAFGSKDGVIIVKKELLNDFSRVASEQLKRENKIREIIEQQPSNFNYKKLVEEFGRW